VGEWKFVVKKGKAKKLNKTHDTYEVTDMSKTEDSKPGATKAKRTFLEIVLGEGKSQGECKTAQQKKEKEHASAKFEALSKVLAAIGDDECLKDYKASIVKDLALAKKASASKSTAVQIEAKAAFVDREAKRLTELEADIVKAQDALALRKAALAAEQVALQAMKEELLKGNEGSTRSMDVDLVALGELERKELELLRELYYLQARWQYLERQRR
jgi:hypothetical protein